MSYYEIPYVDIINTILKNKDLLGPDFQIPSDPLMFYNMVWTMIIENKLKELTPSVADYFNKYSLENVNVYSQDTLDNIPSELLELILEHVELIDIFSIAEASKILNKRCSSKRIATMISEHLKINLYEYTRGILKWICRFGMYPDTIQEKKTIQENHQFNDIEGKVVHRVNNYTDKSNDGYILSSRGNIYKILNYTIKNTRSRVYSIIDADTELLENFSDVIQIESTNNELIILSNNGTIYQLNYKNKKYKQLLIENIIKVVAGHKCTLALANKGDVYIWGTYRIDGKRKTVSKPSKLDLKKILGSHIDTIKDIHYNKLGKWFILVASNDMMYFYGKKILYVQASNTNTNKTTYYGLGDNSICVKDCSIKFTRSGGIELTHKDSSIRILKVSSRNDTTG